jgi:hypothetical protein
VLYESPDSGALLTGDPSIAGTQPARLLDPIQREGADLHRGVGRRLAEAVTSKGLVRSTSPFSDRVPLRRGTWLEPTLVAEVSYAAVTANGLRAPVFRGLSQPHRTSEVEHQPGSAVHLAHQSLPLLSHPKTKPDTHDAANSTADHRGNRD